MRLIMILLMRTFRYASSSKTWLQILPNTLSIAADLRHQCHLPCTATNSGQFLQTLLYPELLLATPKLLFSSSSSFVASRCFLRVMCPILFYNVAFAFAQKSLVPPSIYGVHGSLLCMLALDTCGPSSRSPEEYET